MYSDSVLMRSSRLLLCAASILMLPVVASAQNNWQGGTSNLFNDGSNWSLGLPSVNGTINNLVFGAADRYIVSQNIHDGTETSGLRFLYLTFTEEAEQGYQISSPVSTYGFRMENNGVLSSKSALTHTIQSRINFLGGTSFFDIQDGSLIFSGAGMGATILVKSGLGKLVLSGDHTTGNKTLVLRGGELELDIAGGASFLANTAVSILPTYSTTGTSVAHGGILRVLGGGTTVNMAAFTVGNNLNAAYQVVIDAGTNLVFTAMGTPTTNQEWGSTSLNIDLSAAGSVLTAPLSIQNGINRTVTVTSGGKTGFATVSGGNVVRNETFSGGALPVSAFNNTYNYTLSGDLTRTAGAHTIYSLTITGSGTYNQTTGSFTPTALLMEEGVGDYTINARYHPSTEQFLIHQYSTDGKLILNAGMGPTAVGGVANNARLVKSGPGTVVVNGDSNGMGSYIIINGGRMELNGTFSSLGANGVGGVIVSNGGTLTGSAEIGKWTGYAVARQATIVVTGGGTLDASNNGKDSLEIAGAVTLNEGATFHMVLGETRGSALNILRTLNPSTTVSSTILTLSGDLSLELTYAPELAEKIILLTWDESFVRSGQFLTINGQSFLGEFNDYFTLNYGGEDYGFNLVYDDLGGEIYLNTVPVPEPATVALLAGLALGGLVWLRRKRV